MNRLGGVETRVSWPVLLNHVAGNPGPRVEGDGSEFISAWVITETGEVTGAVVVTEATGYRSSVRVAVAVGRDGGVRAMQVMSHGESAYVDRMFLTSGALAGEDGVVWSVGGVGISDTNAGVGRPDGLSSATITARALTVARDKAVRVATRIMEDRS